MVASLFERRARDCITTLRRFWMQMARCSGFIARCTFPDDPLYYEKFYFTPGDMGFLNFDTQYGRIGTLVCWDQWYPEGARLSSLGGAQRALLSDRDRLASVGKRASTAQRSSTPGGPSSERTRSRMVSTFAAVNRVGFEGPPDHGLEFWGSSFIADPFGQVIAQASTTKKKCSLPSATRARWTRSGAIGRFCATAASTPTAILTSGGSANTHRARVTACRRSGSRTRERGSRGRMRKPTGRANSSPIPWVYCEIVKRLAALSGYTSWLTTSAVERNARKLLKTAHADSPAVDFSSCRPIGAGREIFAPSLSAMSAESRSSPTGGSMAGPSTRTGRLTMRSPSDRRIAIGYQTSPAEARPEARRAGRRQHRR